MRGWWVTVLGKKCFMRKYMLMLQIWERTILSGECFRIFHIKKQKWAGNFLRIISMSFILLSEIFQTKRRERAYSVVLLKLMQQIYFIIMKFSIQFTTR